jgi:Fe2+/Zn2+ uptake regulation proteins
LIDTNYLKIILKEKGLKVTNQRVLILQVLTNESDKHLTAEEIYQLVKVEYPEIGLATVYRTIQLFLELNLINRINLDDGYVRYEIGDNEGTVGQYHHHHHLICLKCKKITSFEGELVNNIGQCVPDSYNFDVVDYEVKLYGYCYRCSAKLKLENNVP